MKFCKFKNKLKINCHIFYGKIQLLDYLSSRSLCTEISNHRVDCTRMQQCAAIKGLCEWRFDMRVVSSRPNVALIKALWGGGGGGGGGALAALPTEACIISSYNNVERASKSN